MIKIFFVGTEWKTVEQRAKLRKKMALMTPGCSGKWKNIKAVGRARKADWIVVLEDTTDQGVLSGQVVGRSGKAVGKGRVLVFPREPPYIRRKTYPRYGLKWGLGYQRIYHVLANLDCLGMDYDRLMGLPIPPSSGGSGEGGSGRRGRICCVVSGKRHTKGANQRLSFVKRFVSRYPGVMDVYGRGNLSFLGADWKGPVKNKFDVLKNYEMSLCMENGQVWNYFTEKITDVILAWSFPIYWGCPNIGNYFDSSEYFYLDINSAGAVDELREMIDSGLPEGWELALAGARERILGEFNIWENIWRIANKKGLKKWN